MDSATKDQLREFLHWAAALQRAMETTLRAENPENVWRYASFAQFARKYDQIIRHMSKFISLPPILDVYDMGKMPTSTNTIAIQQKTYWEGIYANVCLLRSVLEKLAGHIEDEFSALRDFLQARLRSAMFEPPSSERAVQNAVEQLLIGRGLQKGQGYDREVGRVKVSAKEVVPDFILPPLGAAIEVKIVKEAARAKTCIDEINADIRAYSKRYERLLFLVYDLGFIRDEAEFRQDLENAANLAVVVVKH